MSSYFVLIDLATMESIYVYADDDALQMGDGGDLHQEIDHRLLQANFTETAALTDTEILRTTCKLYGSIFAILFFLFLLVRNMKPEVFNLKKTYPELATPVAEVSVPCCMQRSRLSSLSLLSHQARFSILTPTNKPINRSSTVPSAGSGKSLASRTILLRKSVAWMRQQHFDSLNLVSKCR